MNKRKGHGTAWERHSIKKNFLLHCYKEVTPVRTTKPLHNILKASDPSNAKVPRLVVALMNKYMSF